MNSRGNDDHLKPFMRPSAMLGAHDDVPAQGEEECGLPDRRAGDVGCCARPANKPCFSIHFLKPDGSVRSFQMKFLGMEPLKVTVRGRNLWTLYDLVHCHRMPWIMEAARDMGQGGKDPVVTAIRFEAESDDGGH
jgi:hypothetical protein